MIAFLPSPADGAIGALDWSSTERKRLAAKSKDFCCPSCGKVANLLPALKDNDGGATKKPSRFQKEIEELQRMQNAEHNNKKDETEEEEDKKELTEESKPSPAESATETVAVTMESSTDVSTDAPAEVPRSPSPPTAAVKATTNPGESTTGPNENERTETPNVAPARTEEPNPAAGAAAAIAAPAPRVEQSPPVAAHPMAVEADNEAKPSWLVEPVLHTAILVLTVICFLLMFKIQALCAELQALEE